MAEASPQIDQNYWQSLVIEEGDLEALSAFLLEVETPLSPQELAEQLIQQRLSAIAAEEAAQAASAAVAYIPKERYENGQRISFETLDDRVGEVVGVRKADTLNGAEFEVIEVRFEGGDTAEFAAGLEAHALNEVEVDEVDEGFDPVQEILQSHSKGIVEVLEAALRKNEDFVYIAGQWFPTALTAEFSEGQLNVAEALLDVAQGGPLATEEILKEVGLPDGVNPKLASFSLDLALQEDERFDEVGTTGVVAWFLRRLEPNDVQHTPLFLRYEEREHDRASLTDEMLDLELRLHDELSPIDDQEDEEVEQVEVRLIFPHWRSGSLPLTNSMSKLFPTAYESPRVRFEFVDEQSGERYPGWVVRNERYVDGLRKWYTEHGLMPGSYVKARRGEQPGEIIVWTDAHHSSKEWVRTALIGADGGVVYAMLKQTVESAFDERMMIYMPSDIEALNASWEKARPKLEPVVLHAIRELTKLSPQQHAHVSEIYAAVNVVMRCPPAPIMALLAAHADISHVGHLHFRLNTDSEDLEDIQA